MMNSLSMRLKDAFKRMETGIQSPMLRGAVCGIRTLQVVHRKLGGFPAVAVAGASGRLQI